MNVLMVTADHLMIDRRIVQEAGTLVEQGHQVTLLAGFECPKRESYVMDGIRIERFEYDWGHSPFAPIARKLRLRPSSRLERFLARAWRWLSSRLLDMSSFDDFVLQRLMEYPVDVLHVHDFPMLRAGVELARVRKVPLVYDAHELYYAQVQLSEATQRRYKRAEKRWIRHADHTITVNPYIARLMAERYEVPAPTVIFNAAPSQPKSTARPLRERFGLSPGARIVLYQGWISDNRGIDRLVLAARDFREGTVLVIVGYGAYLDTLRQLVEAHGLALRVHFYGGVDSDQLHPVTCDADLGVIPYFGVDDNNYYCSPNKLFEFAIAELPFLSNDLPFLRDIGQRYGNGVSADLGSPGSIAEAVNRILGDPDAMARLRAGALAAKRELNWEVEGRKLLAVYESLDRPVQSQAAQQPASAG
ncbi:MAG: glycosyltransferase [Ramlibacter sp.]|nr:glycosyltransferase [Ramlibacter sp.]